MPRQCCKDTWEKIPDDEPVFIIRGQDLLAQSAIAKWIEEAERLGVNEEKVARARRHLLDVIGFQSKHPVRCKLPD